MATVKYITVPTKRLAESITGASTSFKVSNIEGWDGVDLTSADFGTRLWVVFRNSANTLMEIMEVDPATIISASTAITILTRGLKFTGDQSTEVSANKLTWVKGDTVVEFGTSVPQLLEMTVRTIGDQTVAGIKTFSSLPTIPAVPVANTDAASKAYVDGVVSAGAADANTTTKGLVEEATQAEADAKTATGGTGAKLFQNLSTVRSTLLNDYKVDTGAANAYVITPAPAITAYTTGQIFSFKAVNANTTTSTINVNTLGVKTIKKTDASVLVANDILAGQIVVIEYDGTDFIMVSPPGNAINKTGAGVYPAVDGSLITKARIFEALTAGATISGATLPVPVYINSSDNQIYACDGNVQTALNFIGFAITDGTDNNPITVQLDGVVAGFSGLTPGAKYYVQDAIGTIGTSMGTYEVYVGVAISASQVYIEKGPTSGMQYMGTASESAGTITSPAGARMCVINATNNATSGDGSTSNGDIVIFAKGKTTGSFSNKAGAAGQPGVSVSWSGTTITVTYNITGGDSSGAATAYFYR